MLRNRGSRTSATLLGRLRRHPADQAAWCEFVDRYGGKVYSWGRWWNLQDSDAKDLTQTVLVKLALKMQDFAYDPSLSFRAWLYMLTRNAWNDFIADRKRLPQNAGGSDLAISLENTEAREDLVRRLEEEFDLELMEEASARARLRVKPRTWEAFWLTAIERLPATDVAERLEMNLTTVYRARSFVGKIIREEIIKLERA